MTTFDRLAWRCSLIGPVAFLSGVAALVLDWAIGAGPQVTQARSLLPLVALVLLVAGMGANMVVQYHAVKAGTLPPGTDRDKLVVAMRWSLTYGKWRTLMRERHPELRRRTHDRA